MLFMLYQFFRTAENAGALFDLADLMKVHSRDRNDRLLPLQQFIDTWDAVLVGMKDQPDENTKEVLFKEQIENYAELEHDMHDYWKAKPGDPKRSYKFLLDSAKDYLQRQREQNNRAAVQNKLTGGKRGSAFPVNDKHPSAMSKDQKDAARKSSGGRSRSPSKGKGRSSSRTGDGICKFHSSWTQKHVSI